MKKVKITFENVYDTVYFLNEEDITQKLYDDYLCSISKDELLEIAKENNIKGKDIYDRKNYDLDELKGAETFRYEHEWSSSFDDDKLYFWSNDFYDIVDSSFMENCDFNNVYEFWDGSNYTIKTIESYETIEVEEIDTENYNTGHYIKYKDLTNNEIIIVDYSHYQGSIPYIVENNGSYFMGIEEIEK